MDSLDFAEAAKAMGYDRIVVQRGAGTYMPHNLVTQGQMTATLPSGIETECVNSFQSLDSFRHLAGKV